MAALGWLLNLDFAGGAADAAAAGSGMPAAGRLASRRYSYNYGYRYAEVWRWLIG